MTNKKPTKDHHLSSEGEEVGINPIWILPVVACAGVLVVVASLIFFLSARRDIDQASPTERISQGEVDERFGNEESLDKGWRENLPEEIVITDEKLREEYLKLLERKFSSDEWSYIRFEKTTKAEVISRLGNDYEVIFRERVNGRLDERLEWEYGKHHAWIDFRDGIVIDGNFPLRDDPLLKELLK